jgi:hypothetical protein
MAKEELGKEHFESPQRFQASRLKFRPHLEITFQHLNIFVFKLSAPAQKGAIRNSFC